MRLIDADAIKWRIDEDSRLYVVAQDVRCMPTADPVHAAGGCYCRECKYARASDGAFDFDGETPLFECDYITVPCRGYEHCSWGKKEEAQGDE